MSNSVLRRLAQTGAAFMRASLLSRGRPTRIIAIVALLAILAGASTLALLRTNCLPWGIGYWGIEDWGIEDWGIQDWGIEDNSSARAQPELCVPSTDDPGRRSFSFTFPSFTTPSFTTPIVDRAYVDPDSLAATQPPAPTRASVFVNLFFPTELIASAHVDTDEVAQGLRLALTGFGSPAMLRAVRAQSVPTAPRDSTLVGLAGSSAFDQTEENPEDVVLPPPGSGYIVYFELDQDAFGFRNYGSQYPEGNLTPDDVRMLFGDQVCSQLTPNGSCVPAPDTQFWIDTMNDYMSSGHCAGFTVAVARFRQGLLEPQTVDANASIPFQVQQNVPIMRQIARDWVLQLTPEAISQSVTGTPRQIIDQLLARQQMVDLGVFSRSGGGHSLLAYGVVDKGDGIFHILVYDNNWPGQEVYVEVDYRANTWRYSLAATDPSQDAKAWDGTRAPARSCMCLWMSTCSR